MILNKTAKPTFGLNMQSYSYKYTVRAYLTSLFTKWNYTLDWIQVSFNVSEDLDRKGGCSKVIDQT